MDRLLIIIIHGLLKKPDTMLINCILTVFKNSRNNYGTRRIKEELKKFGYNPSRRKISKIMRQFGLVSKYTKKYFKVHKAKCNEQALKNELNRDFNNRSKLEVSLHYLPPKGYDLRVRLKVV